MNLHFKDIWALLPNDKGDMSYRRCSVYVSGERIAGIDRVPEGWRQERTIDGEGLILSPGLINAHTHAYMTGFRNIADDLDFNTWLYDRIMPMEEKLNPEDAEKWALCACREMLAGGVTCFCDMHMFPMSSVKAATTSGMRAVISRGLAGGGDDNGGGERRLNEAIDEIKEAADYPNISFMLAPHAPYSCDKAYLKKIAETALSMGLGIHTHLSESAFETEFCREKYGLTPTEFFDSCGLLTERSLAAHCVHLTDGDIDILARRGVSVATNPASNLKLGNGIAPIPALLARGVNVCLGTDSAASNNNLSVLRELSLVTLLHKGISGDMCAVSAREGFCMATSNAAKALSLHELGEIREGFLADLAVFNAASVGMMPLGDPYSALCYGSWGLDAEMTLVGGKIVYEKDRMQERYEKTYQRKECEKNV